MADVAGRYLGTRVGGRFQGSFVYQYDCARCRETFEESAPAVSSPAVCHKCLNGGRVKFAKGRRRSYLPKNRRGVVNSMPSGKRKSKHKHDGD